MNDISFPIVFIMKNATFTYCLLEKMLGFKDKLGRRRTKCFIGKVEVARFKELARRTGSAAEERY
jgi:hypothetical protein